MVYECDFLVFVVVVRGIGVIRMSVWMMGILFIEFWIVFYFRLE